MKLCLTMIVKDEEKTLARSIRSCLPFVNSWCVVDTGSTDRTKEIVKELLGHLPGNLYERPWKNFGHNRTEAIDLAREMFPGGYALMVDADDVMETPEGYELPELTKDQYDNLVRYENLTYLQPHVFRLAKPFYFEGVTHEYLACLESASHGGTLDGFVYRIFGDGSSHDASDKYRRDAEALVQELKQHPDDLRTMFYLAQSYRDSGEIQKALEVYTKRSSLGGWAEETFLAKLEKAKCQERLGLDPMVAYLQAYEFRTQRAEGLYELGRYLRQKERYALSVLFLDKARQIPKPDDRLFVDASMYAYKAHAEFAISAHYVGRTDEAIAANKLALAKAPAHDQEWIVRNLRCAEPGYETFKSWYVEGGIGSGHGSSPEYTERYREFLTQFMRENRYKTVLDWGCGDWQFSKLMDWAGITYLGVDIVEPLVDRLRERHGAKNILFHHVLPKTPVLIEGTQVDLLICKDVLQHLPNEDVQDLLQVFRCAKNVLLINDNGKESNQDISPGGYRCINPNLDPFCLPSVPVFGFADPRELKTAFLWTPDRALHVPKLIHQTWKNSCPPEDVYDPKWIESWKTYHPGWTYRLWTDDDLLDLARTARLDVAFSEAPGVVKADIGRYLILYYFGGMYADLDYECLRNMEPMLLGHRLVSSWDSPQGTLRRCVNQAWMAADPGQPFFLELAQEAAQRWVRGVRPVGMATGPDMVTELWNRDSSRIHMLSDSRICPIHWHGGQSIAGGTLTKAKIDELRPVLKAQGAYAVTYWTHHWQDTT